jgi:hypothetical protein
MQISGKSLEDLAMDNNYWSDVFYFGYALEIVGTECVGIVFCLDKGFIELFNYPVSKTSILRQKSAVENNALIALLNNDQEQLDDQNAVDEFFTQKMMEDKQKGPGQSGRSF